jgi:hypothetical protein
MPRNRQKYPTEIGLTGEVYTKGKTFWSNEVAKHLNYQPSVDNASTMSNVKEVKSIVIIPIYGHAGWGNPLGIPAKPNGIIQFINKCTYSTKPGKAKVSYPAVITKHDVVSIFV